MGWKFLSHPYKKVLCDFSVHWTSGNCVIRLASLRSQDTSNFRMSSSNVIVHGTELLGTIK